MARLVQDMLSRVHNYILPCETVFKARLDDNVDIDRKKLRAALAALRESVEFTSTNWGPIQDPVATSSPPEEEEAVSIIERRFGPFFDKQKPVDRAG